MTQHWRFRKFTSALAVAAIGFAGALVVPGAAAAGSTGPVVDLRGDVNRDSWIDMRSLIGASDEDGEDAWTRDRGIIVLPNLDDDNRRCPVRTSRGKPLPFKTVVSCNDASDGVVNGAADAADLAPLRTMPLPHISAAARGTVALSGGARFGRVFLRSGAGWRLLRPADALTANQLRTGVELGLEATDLIRDARRWDGRLRVRFTVRDGERQSSDTVVARVAPLLTHHHAQRTERILVSALGRADPDQSRFVTDLRRKVGPQLITVPTDDPWTQDFVEPAYVSAPGSGGRPQTMRILIRSAQPDRESGEQLWRRLRGPGVGAIQVPVRPDGGTSLDSMGNLETIPPYAGFPAGRIIMGWSPTERVKPEAAMRKLLSGQGYQEPLLLDTSWLAVGHVDEFLQFLPAPTARGWRLAISDPRAGLDVLRKLKAAGHGNSRMFSKPGSDRMTVAQALASRTLLADNAVAAAKIDANVAILQRETGLTDAEIVRIPGLYGRLFLDTRAAQFGILSADRSAEAPQVRAVEPMGAFVPGAINSLLAAPDRVIAARQWGPVVRGVDAFAKAVTAAYGSAGIRVDYIDDWAVYHLAGGEVHCGTNALRSMTTPWWGDTIGWPVAAPAAHRKQRRL